MEDAPLVEISWSGNFIHSPACYMQINDRIVFSLLHGLGWFISRWPRRLTLAWGRGLGSFMYTFIPLRKDVAGANLARAYPGISAAERSDLVKATFRHFGMVLMDFIRIPYIPGDEFSRVFVITDDQLQAAHKQNRGVVLLSGHLGNWELVLLALGARGYPLMPIIMQQPGGGGRYVDWVRSKTGCEVINKKASSRDMLNILNDGKILGIAGDQDARDKGIWVRFFGIPSSRHRGAALFSHHTGAPMILCTCVMEKDHRYHITFTPVEKETSNTRLPASENAIQQYMDALEATVRAYPEQYFWFHRLWKTSPRGDR